MSEMVWLDPCPDSVWELLPGGPVADGGPWHECWQYMGSAREEAGRLRHEFRHRSHPDFDNGRGYAHVLDDDSGPRLGRLVANDVSQPLPGNSSEEV